MALLVWTLLAAFVLYADARHYIDLFQQKDNFEGDIVIGKDRNAIFKTKRWTDGIIPYVFDDYWTDGYQRMVLKAFKEISDHTCIRFVPRKNETNYVQIINQSGCWSPVGMEGGRQYVSLKESSWGSCWVHGTIVHEFLHATGLWHEQSRPDRDDYITIHYDNIPKSLQYNFEKRSKNNTETYGVPYNYLSVMHYDSMAFSNNGKITIETKDKSMQYRIGHRDHAVETDYEKIRRLYDCKGSYPKMPVPTVAPPTPPPPCIDTVSYCNEYPNSCNEQWAQSACRKSCNLCTVDPNAPTTAPVPQKCEDTVDYCHEYKDRCKYELWMEDYCRKSCKLCK